MISQNNYKVIFSDVDGTLLNKEREISINTVLKIQSIAKKYNILFVMVSARMPQGMLHLYNQIALDFPIICYNGALILKSLHGGYNPQNIIHSNSINYQAAKELYSQAKSKDLHFSVFSNNSWHTNQMDEWALREENNTRVKANVCENLETLLLNIEKHNEPIHKLMVMGDAHKIDNYIDFTNNTFSNQIVSYRSKNTYVEISPITSNKAQGCLFLLNHMAIPSNDTIAFGDNHNDVEMLKAVGLGIAMDNAPDEVKKIAKQIAPSNVHEGVAFKLEEIFG